MCTRGTQPPVRLVQEQIVKHVVTHPAGRLANLPASCCWSLTNLLWETGQTHTCHRVRCLGLPCAGETGCGASRARVKVHPARPRGGHTRQEIGDMYPSAPGAVVHGSRAPAAALTRASSRQRGAALPSRARRARGRPSLIGGARAR